MKSYFVTATDTDAGKTLITALIANYFESKFGNTITQKWIQTGNISKSSDLEYHLNFFNKNFDKFNFEETEKIKNSLCPYILKLPASPHLAANFENIKIDKHKIIDSYRFLAANFENIIVEGSGGVLVPYNYNDFIIDIAKELDLEFIIVAVNKLGAINHTLLTIEALKSRNCRIKGIIFNNKVEPKYEDLMILQENIYVISKFSNVEVLGELIYSENKDFLIENFNKIGNKL